MRLRLLLAAAATVSATTFAGMPAAHACTGDPCDIACNLANSKVGQKLGLTCPR
jgi:hypothetical protein